ncbi:MAG: immunity 17 family protein [Cyanobacteria bacterium P01_A01_bin.123]
MDPAGLILVAVGLFSAAGDILNWEWFMNHRKARFMCAILTRTGARIFYVILGLGIAVAGALLTLGII